jgi:hypothetical protein
MTPTTILSALPLLTSGLTRTCESWLRAAGIPLESYVPGRSIHEFLQTHPGRFVLFDSRNPASRAEAETALQFDREIIDCAPQGLLDSQGYSSQHPLRYQELAAQQWILLVIEELKKRQGVWLRIYDLPSPYDSVIFTDGLPRQPELRLVAEALSVVRDSVADDDLCIPLDGDTLLVEEDCGTSCQFGCWWSSAPAGETGTVANNHAPTVWSVTSDEFARWWAYRSSLEIQLYQGLEELRLIVPQAGQSEWTPTAELWRNAHTARFPVTHSLIVLQRSSMVYGLCRYRHPAGLFLSQGRPMLTAPPVSVSA